MGRFLSLPARLLPRDHPTPMTPAGIPRFRTREDAAAECFAATHSGHRVERVWLASDDGDSWRLGVRYHRPLAKPPFGFSTVRVHKRDLVAELVADDTIAARYHPLSVR